VWLRYAVDQTAMNITVPVALFHDRRDRDAAFAESVAIAQVWKGAQLIETAGLGHQRILRDETVIRQAINFISN
jgi:pimeloyl-ACP methyl ester carboxylesterase